MFVQAWALPKPRSVMMGNAERCESATAHLKLGQLSQPGSGVCTHRTMGHRPPPVLVTAGLALSLCIGCAGRIVPAPSGSLNEPRASWSIRAGEYGSEREVCRSDRDQSCLIPASTEANPTSVVASVYLYPAGENATIYRGALMATFMGLDGSGSETKIDYSTKPGERPYYVATVGRVTSAPGNYQFRIAVLAEVAGRTDPRQFEKAIPVQVVPPPTAFASE